MASGQAVAQLQIGTSTNLVESNIQDTQPYTDWDFYLFCETPHLLKTLQRDWQIEQHRNPTAGVNYLISNILFSGEYLSQLEIRKMWYKFQTKPELRGLV